MPQPSTATVPPPPSSAPWCAAASTPRAMPLTTVTPAAASSAPRSRAVSRAPGAARREPTTATQGLPGGGRRPITQSSAGGLSRCSRRSGQPGEPRRRWRATAGVTAVAPRRGSAAPRPRRPPHLNRPAEVGDGASHAQDAEEAAGAQLQSLPGEAENLGGRGRRRRDLLQFPAVEGRIAGSALPGARVAAPLSGASGLHPLTHHRRRLSGLTSEQVSVALPRHVDDEVDAVADGPAEAVGVLAEGAGCAA